MNAKDSDGDAAAWAAGMAMPTACAGRGQGRQHATASSTGKNGTNLAGMTPLHQSCARHVDCVHALIEAKLTEREDEHQTRCTGGLEREGGSCAR